jgi:hypothetical protein
MSLSSNGEGRMRLAFGRGTIKSVHLVLANASTRTRCWTGTDYGCHGSPTDQSKRYLFKAALS